MNDAPNPSPARAYHDYLGPAMFEPWGHILLDLAQPRTGETVLDLACGTGIVTRQLSGRMGAGEVMGIDINEDMLAIAREQPMTDGAGIEYRSGDACALDIDSNEVDLVVCQQGFQFFPDRDAAAVQMRRVLREDGRVAIAVWTALEDQPVFRALFEAEARYLGIEVADLAVPFSLGDEADLRRHFAEAGFSHIKTSIHDRETRLPDPERFFELAIAAGAAVIPELAELSPDELAKLVASIRGEISDEINQYLDSDSIRFPMRSRLLLAQP